MPPYYLCCADWGRGGMGCGEVYRMRCVMDGEKGLREGEAGSRGGMNGTVC